MKAKEKHCCDNCGRLFTEDKLHTADRLWERLDPGGVCPSGQCPRCGCLCYPVKKVAK